MKIVHTGDWHIGKIVNEYSMIEEQKYYLDKLVELLREKEAEALITVSYTHLDVYKRQVFELTFLFQYSQNHLRIIYL